MLSRLGLSAATVAPIVAAQPAVGTFVLSDDTSYCLVRNTTGLLCPACGLTHAMIDFAQGSLADATRANLLIWLYLGLLLAGWLAVLRVPIPNVRWVNTVWLKYNFGWLLLSTLASFTVIRNL